MIDDEPPGGIRAQAEDRALYSSTQFEILVDAVREYAIYLMDLNGHVMS